MPRLNKTTLSMSKVKDTRELVTVKISSKEGWKWEMSGDAGMVVSIDNGHAEVDMIGTKENIVLLLATALYKVKKLMGEEIVKKAIKKSKERL
jgi:hypothetical protein